AAGAGGRRPRRARRATAQPVDMLLAELGELRRDHYLAVALPGVAGVVIIVIILGGVEVRQRLDAGDELAGVDTRGAHLGRHFPCRLGLGRVVREDGGAVLRAYVVPLTVHRGGVVDGEEHVEQVAVTDDAGVV